MGNPCWWRKQSSPTCLATHGDPMNGSEGRQGHHRILRRNRHSSPCTGMISLVCEIQRTRKLQGHSGCPLGNPQINTMRLRPQFLWRHEGNSRRCMSDACFTGSAMCSRFSDHFRCGGLLPSHHRPHPSIWWWFTSAFFIWLLGWPNQDKLSWGPLHQQNGNGFLMVTFLTLCQFQPLIHEINNWALFSFSAFSYIFSFIELQR